MEFHGIFARKIEFPWKFSLCCLSLMVFNGTANAVQMSQMFQSSMELPQEFHGTL